MKEKITQAMVDAAECIEKAKLPEEYKETAFKEAFRMLASGGVVTPGAKPMAGGVELNAEHESFVEFFVDLNCKTKPDELTAMAYYHAAKNKEDPRLSVKDVKEYYQHIKPKAGNIFRDAKTAVINAWLKPAEKKDGNTAWEIIPLGRKRVEELKKNEA